MRVSDGAKASGIRVKNLSRIKNNISILNIYFNYFLFFDSYIAAKAFQRHMCRQWVNLFSRIEIPCRVLHGIFCWPRGCAWRILRNSTPGRIGFFSVEHAF